MHLSFRNRLTFFFILLVILPVLAVASVGILIVRNSEEGKNNDALEQAQRAAEGLYNDAEERAVVVARTVQLDDELAVAVRDGDRAAQQARLEALARRGGAQLVRLTLDGQEPVEAGPGNEVVAPARSRVLDADGRRAGMLSLSVTSASAYANLLARVTGQEVVLTQDGELVAATIEGVSAEDLPQSGETEIDGDEYRVTGFKAPAFDEGEMIGVHVLVPREDLQNAVSENTLGIFLILLAFLICALAFALTAARSLQLQTTRLLEAAKQIGRGDFSVEVPTEGNDEFGALGKEFNSMARQLEARLEELQLERQRLQETVQRVGESIGTGLDRDATLAIVVQTAVDGVGADCGRVMMRKGANGALSEAARAGNVSSYMAAVQAAESAALKAGEAAETQISGANALARPLHAPEPEEGVLGVISIARPGLPVHGSPARAVRLPREPGRDLDRERRPARDDPAPGGHGRAHRACSTTAASRRS